MSVSIVYARALVAEFEARGLNPNELLAASGVDPERLTNIREKLMFDELSRLTRNAVAATDDPGLGLAIGSKVPLNVLQLISYLLLSQRSIREASNTFMRYSALVTEGPAFQLLEEGDVATWALLPALPTDDVIRVLVDYGIVLAARVGRQLRPPGEQDGTRLLAVHFQHAEPGYSARYGEIFECPILFGQKVNGLVFPRAILDSEQSHADETVGSLLRESAERLLRETTQVLSWGDRTRTALRYSPYIGDATLESVARSLKLSARGLGRRLRAENLSFSGLLDEARCRVACEQLGRVDVTTQEVADLLGFSEVSAFFRAFKRWTGCTPSEFRARRREAASSAEPMQRQA